MSDSVREAFDSIESEVAQGAMTAAQVFTQMKQLVQTALSANGGEGSRKLSVLAAQLHESARCLGVAQAKEDADAKEYWGQISEAKLEAISTHPAPPSVAVPEGWKSKVLELCSAVENDEDLPPVKYALKCGRLINEVKDILTAAPSPDHSGDANKVAEPFQTRVNGWMQECFGPEISADKVERNHRFLEEALELVQSLGCTQAEAHKLVDYVYGRAVGDPPQEVGGVMVTLAALCLASGMDMDAAAETELARILQPEVVTKIREKQKLKPAFSPLPGSYPERKPISVDRNSRGGK